ncbi:IS630 transposase-related protein [Candidatus Protochlamydia sp. W-9]|uniref:IS630 transposase-related protein n=1 Tax=Candidatus Protochlamydia sp. W-9 TaxID=1785087 RepID=UPI000ABB2D0D|nr:IS630 transposase-related protein [Candidatus Protochlamydia sp. W-9]
MAYSKDLRQKALNYLEIGHSAEEVRQAFWANFKQLVRLSLNKFSSLAKAIDYSFCQICT